VPLLFNKTSYPIELTPLIDKDGRNEFVVIAKATFELSPAGELAPAAAQEPVTSVDEFMGEPGSSPVRTPSDLVDYKPGTDVVVVPPKGFSDQSPYVGRTVGIAVGPVRKSVRVRDIWPLGALRRDDAARLRYAGTYDQAWQSERMPMLPVDFDSRHNLVAPTDQVAPLYLAGNETVTVTDIFRPGPVTFGLPSRAIVVAANVLQRYFTAVARFDTLLVWPDRVQVALVWRLPIPCRRKHEEVGNVFVYDVTLRSARQLFGSP